MKPENEEKRIIAAITNPHRVRQAVSRQIITMEKYPEPMTLVIHEGMLAAYRTRGKLLMKYFQGPMLVGMNALMDMNANFYFKACGEVKYEIIPRNEVLNIIDRERLWKEAALLYMFGIKRLIEINNVSVGLSTYEIIRENIIALINEKDDLRLTVNVCDYIQEKTRLSRSRVMKILSDLRIDGHIDIKRGILIAVHKLPEKY